MKRAPIIHIAILAAFLANIFGPLPIAQAQDLFLPTPGAMVHLSPEFNPPLLKGIKVHPENPFRFDFILDQGDDPNSIAVKQESTKLIKYFLTSLTIPEKDLWVNLSPYEKNRIVPDSFGQTEMGRDLLAEDYILKQITASLIYPEDEIGKKFWKRIYAEAFKKFGTTNIPVNTFNKVWILPEKAVIYENTSRSNSGTQAVAYIVESKLKVMLEQDYLSLERNSSSGIVKRNETSALGSQIVREIVIPELTKEINEGKNFSKLRQVYHSLILATWYKKKIKESILSQVYANRSKVEGIKYQGISKKETDVELIYKRYLQAFKKGAYNYIKDEVDPVTQEIVPKKYFSGGVTMLAPDGAMSVRNDSAMFARIIKTGLLHALVLGVSLLTAKPTQAEDVNKPESNNASVIQVSPKVDVKNLKEFREDLSQEEMDHLITEYLNFTLNEVLEIMYPNLEDRRNLQNSKFYEILLNQMSKARIDRAYDNAEAKTFRIGWLAIKGKSRAEIVFILAHELTHRFHPGLLEEHLQEGFSDMVGAAVLQKRGLMDEGFKPTLDALGYREFADVLTGGPQTSEALMKRTKGKAWGKFIDDEFHYHSRAQLQWFMDDIGPIDWQLMVSTSMKIFEYQKGSSTGLSPTNALGYLTFVPQFYQMLYRSYLAQTKGASFVIGGNLLTVPLVDKFIIPPTSLKLLRNAPVDPPKVEGKNKKTKKKDKGDNSQLSRRHVLALLLSSLFTWPTRQLGAEEKVKKKITAVDFEKAFQNGRINEVEKLLEGFIEQNENGFNEDKIKINVGESEEAFEKRSTKISKAYEDKIFKERVAINEIASKYGYYLNFVEDGCLVRFKEKDLKLQEVDIIFGSIDEKVVIRGNNEVVALIPTPDKKILMARLPFSEEIIDVLPKMVDQIFRKMEADNSLDNLSDLLGAITANYIKDLLPKNSVTLKPAEFRKILILFYAFHRINLNFKSQQKKYLVMEDGHLAKIEREEGSVTFVNPVGDGEMSPFIGITSHGGQSIVNDIFSEEVISGIEGIPLSTVWKKNQDGLFKIAFGKERANLQRDDVRAFKHMIAEHELSHRQRWFRIAQKVLNKKEIDPKNLTFSQFMDIGEQFHQTYVLDEVLARLGEIIKSHKEGRDEDVWVTLYTLTLAPSNIVNSAFIFDVLAGRKDDVLDEISKVLEKKNPSIKKVDRLMNEDIDLQGSGESWSKMISDHRSGKSQTEFVISRAQKVYKILYDVWDKLQKVQSDEDRAMKSREALGKVDSAALAKGGIDFTAEKTPLEIQNAQGNIKFNIDSAQLAEFQNALGFEPTVTSIKSLTDLRAFFM